jgi:site-specific DNA recombinase
MKRAIIYCRVSTDEQRGNYSIPSQVAACVEYAKSKEYAIVGDRFVDPVTGQDAESGIPAFVDDYSSLESNRPALDALFAYLKKPGADVVICYSLDRLDRNPDHYSVHKFGIKQSKAVLEFVKESFDNTPSGVFMERVIAAATELDNNWRTERFTRGKRQKARNGLFVSGKIMFGYEVDKKSSSGISIVPGEADIIKQMYDRYLNHGFSSQRLSEWLNSTGVQTKRGVPWGRSAVRCILLNECYTGVYYYNRTKQENGKTVPMPKESWIRVDIPAIVDRSIYEASLKKMHENKEAMRKKAKHDYLLSGMLFCDSCHGQYSGGAVKSKTTGALRKYYRHARHKEECENPYLPGIVIDVAVWNTVKELLLDTDRLIDGYNHSYQASRGTDKNLTSQYDALVKQSRKIEWQLMNLTGLRIDPDNKMGKEEYVKQRQPLLTKKSEILDQIRSYGDLKPQAPALVDFETIKKFSEMIKSSFGEDSDNWSYEDKRKVLNSLQIQVFFNPKDNTYRVKGGWGETVGLLSSKYNKNTRRCY